SVGEMSLITGELRTATIRAARDCTMVQLLKSDFDDLIAIHPGVALSLSRLTISRLNYTMHHTKAPARTNNIALIPATDSPAIRQLIQELLYALNQESQVRHLHKDMLPAEFR